MERDGQFDDAKARPKMPARRADGVDCFGAQLVNEMAKIFSAEPTRKSAGLVTLIKERRQRSLVHIGLPEPVIVQSVDERPDPGSGLAVE